MKHLIFIFTAALLLSSCKSEQIEVKNACNSGNPMDEVIWLKNLKSSIDKSACDVSIVQGTYNNQTVFFTLITDPLCNSVNMPTLYNCEGDIVRTFNINDYKEFNNLVKTVKILYHSKPSEF